MNAEQTAKIDKYLLGEMTEAEVEKFEGQFLTDDALFYRVAERENELVDAFVRIDLDPGVADKLRKSLAKFPARSAKISNASLLKTHIEETRPIAASNPAPLSWYRRLGFAFQAPALAAAALGLILVGTVGFLLVQNRSLNQQIASLNSSGQDVNQLRRREAELQAELESLRSSGSDLTSDLEAERERRTALEAELSKLRNQIDTGGNWNNSRIVPTIATLVLRPTGIRGGPGDLRRLRLDDNVKRVALKIELPSDGSDGLFSVRVNDFSAGSRIKPVREPGGAGSVTVSVSAESFRTGLNRVEVFDSNSQIVVSFAVVVDRGTVP